MNRLLIATLFAGTLVSSQVALRADDNHDKRVYTDARHGDKHEWNDNEDAAWKRYREQHHIAQENFSKVSKRQQQQYWNWRHDNPDHR